MGVAHAADLLFNTIRTINAFLFRDKESGMWPGDCMCGVPEQVKI